MSHKPSSQQYGVQLSQVLRSASQAEAPAEAPFFDRTHQLRFQREQNLLATKPPRWWLHAPRSAQGGHAAFLRWYSARYDVPAWTLRLLGVPDRAYFEEHRRYEFQQALWALSLMPQGIVYLSANKLEQYPTIFSDFLHWTMDNTSLVVTVGTYYRQAPAEIARRFTRLVVRYDACDLPAGSVDGS